MGLPPYIKEADGTSHAAGASGTVKHWLLGGRSCFALPGTSQFLQETFIAVTQPKEKKVIGYCSMGCSVQIQCTVGILGASSGNDRWIHVPWHALLRKASEESCFKLPVF